jgi:hypothetical protein
LEAKIDELLKMAGGKNADQLIREIDVRYLRAGGHAKPPGHDVGHE